MDLAVLKRLDFLQRFLCMEFQNMGSFLDEANHQVEGHLWRGITLTSTGLSLVLSRADAFVRLQNRLGSQIFPGDIYSYLKCVGHQLFFKSWLSSEKNDWCKKTFVTSTCATEKKLENQFSWIRRAVLMRPQWTKQLSTASIYFC